MLGIQDLKRFAVVIPLYAAGTLWAQGGGSGAADRAVAMVERRQPAPACLQRIAEDFTPMTRTERAAEYLRGLIGSRAVVFTAVRAGIDEGWNTPGAWSGGRGFGYRVASSYAQHAISVSFIDGIALGLGEDNRFFASGEQGAGRRLKYAVESAFLARHDDGTRSFSFSGVGGTLAGAFISRGWQPDGHRGAGDAMSSFGISIAIHTGLNLVREFVPGSLRRLVP